MEDGFQGQSRESCEEAVVAAQMRGGQKELVGEEEVGLRKRRECKLGKNVLAGRK